MNQKHRFEMFFLTVTISITEHLNSEHPSSIFSCLFSDDEIEDDSADGSDDKSVERFAELKNTIQNM